MTPSTDPLDPTNIESVRYTRISTSTSDHLLSVINSSLLTDDVFCVTNLNNNLSRNFLITSELISDLIDLETGYQSHLIPALHSSVEEGAAHAAKVETDQLVELGYITAGSSEYYGAWASNYEVELEIGAIFIEAINEASAAYAVFTAISSYYYSWLANTAYTTVSSSQYSTVASYIDDIDDALTGINHSNKTFITAESRNSALAQQGYTSPLPYQTGTPVASFKTTGTTQYVRVYTQGVTTPNGRWLMRYSDIQGLTPAQIQSKFALPNTPTHYCFVNVPSGTAMYSGIVGKTYTSSEYVVQFELSGIIPDGSFGTGYLLP